LKNKPNNQIPIWQRLIKTAKQAWSELLHEPLASITSVLVIAITLVLPLTLFSAANKLESTLSQYADTPQLIAYLRLNGPDSVISEVSERLLSRPDISYIELIPKALGLSQFSQESGLGDLIVELGTNPLPDALVITPLATDVPSLEALSDELNQDPDIESTQLDTQWLLRLRGLIEVIQNLGTLIGLLSALAFFLVVGNTIRAIVQGSIDEIRIQKLIGATDLFVIKPMIFKGLYYGIGGALLATALQLLVFALLNSALADFQTLNESINGSNYTIGVSWGVSTVALIASGVLGALAAALFAKQQLAKLNHG
jgi:cell division transport system permease protein